jgi:hypothetical protein
MSSKDATNPFAPGMEPSEPVNNHTLPLDNDVILRGIPAAKHLELAHDGGFMSQLSKNPFFTAVGITFGNLLQPVDLLIGVLGLRSRRARGSSYSRPKRSPVWRRPPPQEDVG